MHEKRTIPMPRPLAGMCLAVVAGLALGCPATVEFPQVPGEPAPRPPAEGEVVTSPMTPAPDGTIGVRAAGLPTSETVQIGFGQADAEFAVVTDAPTDAEGAVEATFEVPDWAETGLPYVVVVQHEPTQTRIVSDPFVIGARGDHIEVTGELTDEGVECPAMRDQAGTLYTLATGDLGGLVPGDRVHVTGTIAAVTICMQGTTISVEEIHRL